MYILLPNTTNPDISPSNSLSQRLQCSILILNTTNLLNASTYYTYHLLPFP